MPGATTDPRSLDAVRTDRSGARVRGRAAVLVRAGSVGDVQTTLRLAHEHRVAVVPRGGGTGVAGGAVATDGCVVLDVSGMDRILELDPLDEVAVVEPGVITADLDRRRASTGCSTPPTRPAPPSPPSAATSRPTPAACAASSTA